MTHLLRTAFAISPGPGARLLRAVAAILLAAQIGFLLHQDDHHRNFEVMGADDCAMCQFGASLETGPSGSAVIAPAAPVVLARVLLPAAALPDRAALPAPFRSRAPPFVRV